MNKNFTKRTFRSVLFALLSLLMIGSLQAQTINQHLSSKISIKVVDKPLRSILQEVKEKSGISFSIDEDVYKTFPSKSIQADNITVEDVLNRLTTNSGYTWKILHNTILFEKDNSKPQAKQIVKGNVKGRDGKPIAGVTVFVKGTTTGVISNNEGAFNIDAPINSTLAFSFLGFETKEVHFTGQQNINIVLNETAKGIDEIVVTGIFNRAKESYTGSVTEISNKNLQLFKGQNTLSTLANIDPAFNIVADNSFGSDPNNIPEINIRGNASLPTSVEELNKGLSSKLNSPIIIMDGFEISLTKLMDFNDENIERITILKDASATAIYGSRGTNGVVVITTKRPTTGDLRVSLQIGTNIELPDLSSYNLMNAREKLELEYNSGLYNAAIDKGQGPIEDIALKKKYYDKLADIERGVDTYWISQPVRTGIGQQYSLRLDFGTEKFQVAANISNNTVNGVMKGSNRSTTTGLVSLSYKYKNLLFRNQSSVDFNTSKRSNYGTFSDYVKMNPYWRIHDEKGDPILEYDRIGDDKPAENPIYNANLKFIDQSKYTLLINNFSIDWTIIEGLTLRGSLGLSMQDNQNDNYLSPNHSSFNTAEFKKDPDNAFKKGKYKLETGEDMSAHGNVTLNYSKKWLEKHQFVAGFDYSMEQKKNYMYKIEAEGFSADHLNFFPDALKYKEGTKPTGTESMSRSVGFTSNINYTFDNRYFVDMSYRIDGSSLFGSNNRFAPFWSVGLGWNLHHEKFIKESDFINQLRLRISTGDNGSQLFDAYQALSTFKYHTGKKYLTWSGTELLGLANENLKWQTTRQNNLGIDFGFLDNRINGSFDIYNKKTKDLLSSIDIPTESGFKSYVANIGEVNNSGFEASLTGYIIRDYTRKIQLLVTGKIAYNKNKIVRLSQAIKDQTEVELNTIHPYTSKENNKDMARLLYEGYSANSIYVVPSLGIDPSTGKEIFIDREGNLTYIWHPASRRYYGAYEPLYRGNISTLLSYKDFSLNLSFAYHWGGQQYNQTLINRVEVTNEDIEYNVDRRVYSDRWMKPGDVKFFKGLEPSLTRASSRFVMDDNVFEFQSASISYRWHSSKFLNNVGIESVSFRANMSDILYISSIKRERGLTYPYSRRLGVTVSLMF